MNLSEFLNILDFSYDITTDNKIRLIDLQGANLGEIEEERFEINSDTTSNIVERLSTYIDDYIWREFEDALDELNIEYFNVDYEKMIELCKENNIEDVCYEMADVILNPSKITIEKLSKNKEKFSETMPKTYNYKWIDFLNNYNVVEVKNEKEFSEFKEFLRVHKLDGLLNGMTSFCDWQHLAKINNLNCNLFLFEYQNYKGLTWSDNVQEAIDYYDKTPLKPKDLFEETCLEIEENYEKEY